ncbi:MAG: DUF3168 domain-containing protein [Marinibacterium sp.]|nr:DUF3168 domain-containing protein [Marinibacterium sp.]
MSYGVAVALQQAMFQALDTAPAVTAPVFDAPDPGDLPDTYVQLGLDETRARRDSTGVGAEHKVTVSILTTLPGFAAAKSLAVAVYDTLQDADLPLARGQLTALQFDRAKARRDGPAGRNRRIDLRFVARVQDN